MQITGGVANNPAAPTHVYQGFNNRRGARRLFIFKYQVLSTKTKGLREESQNSKVRDKNAFPSVC